MNIKHTFDRAYLVNRERGVTLLELMMVVVIIGIIVAFGYPNYVKQSQKASRSDATSALLAIAAAQEKEYLKNNAYTSDMSLLGGTVSEAKKYELSVEMLDNGGYRAKAIPLSGSSQTGDEECSEFTIDHTGAKRSDGTVANAPGCW